MRAIEVRWNVPEGQRREQDLPEEMSLPKGIRPNEVEDWLYDQAGDTVTGWRLAPDAHILELEVPDGAIPGNLRWYAFRLESMEDAIDVCHAMYLTHEPDMTARLGDATYPCWALFYMDSMTGRCEGTFGQLEKSIPSVIDDLSLAAQEAEEKAGYGNTAPRYVRLAIYDNGDAVATQNADECFMDCTADLAFIKDIHGEPMKLDMGLESYSRSTADFDVKPIGRVDTWRILQSHGWLDWKTGWNDANPLRWALASPHVRDPEVFDYLLGLFPDTELTDMLWKVRSLQAAEWALAHGTDPYYDGLTSSMEITMRYVRIPDADQVYKLAYGKDRPPIGT